MPSSPPSCNKLSATSPLRRTVFFGGISGRSCSHRLHVRGVEFPELRHDGRTPCPSAGRGSRDQEHLPSQREQLRRWFTGFSLAAAAGSPRLPRGREGVFRRLTLPLVPLPATGPRLAWIPVAPAAVGISEKTTVFMIAVTAFPPSPSMSCRVKEVDATYLRAARMLGARGNNPGLPGAPARRPAAHPSGLRVGLATAGGPAGRGDGGRHRHRLAILS